MITKMAEKEIKNIEKEYTIPLREKCRSAVRYKKTPKAVKSIKEFLARHMKVYDRDLNKIKIDKYLNEYLWFRGIKNPPHKVKVKVTKKGDIVQVELAEMSDKLKFKKAREEKRETKSKQALESTKSTLQKAKEQLKGKTKSSEPKEEKLEDKDKDGVDDKVEEKEKKSAVVEAGKKLEKEMAKKEKHSIKQKTPAQKRIYEKPTSLHKG